MQDQHKADAAKKAKNIAAIIYLILLTFIVGGTYINQHYVEQQTTDQQQVNEKSN